jgi:hypothetical protein
MFLNQFKGIFYSLVLCFFAVGCDQAQDSFTLLPTENSLAPDADSIGRASLSGSYTLYSYNTMSRTVGEEGGERHLGMVLDVYPTDEVMHIKSTCGTSELAIKRKLHVQWVHSFDRGTAIQPLSFEKVGENCSEEEEQLLDLATEALMHAQSASADAEKESVTWIHTNIVDVSLRLTKPKVAESLLAQMTDFDMGGTQQVIVMFQQPVITLPIDPNSPEYDQLLIQANRSRAEKILAGTGLTASTVFGITSGFVVNVNTQAILRLIDQPLVQLIHLDQVSQTF